MYRVTMLFGLVLVFVVGFEAMAIEEQKDFEQANDELAVRQLAELLGKTSDDENMDMGEMGERMGETKRNEEETIKKKLDSIIKSVANELKKIKRQADEEASRGENPTWGYGKRHINTATGRRFGDSTKKVFPNYAAFGDSDNNKFTTNKALRDSHKFPSNLAFYGGDATKKLGDARKIPIGAAFGLHRDSGKLHHDSGKREGEDNPYTSGAWGKRGDDSPQMISTWGKREEDTNPYSVGAWGKKEGNNPQMMGAWGKRGSMEEESE